jgi:hypothetical protein
MRLAGHALKRRQAHQVGEVTVEPGVARLLRTASKTFIARA